MVIWSLRIWRSQKPGVGMVMVMTTTMMMR